MKKNRIFAISLLLLLFAGYVFAEQSAQYQEPQILGSMQGLSSGKVNSFVQDRNGFIWVGTEDGLNKYNGNKFTVYRKIENDSTSLHNNYITCLFYDSAGQLWVGSSGGLQYYDDKKGCFSVPPFHLISQIDEMRTILWITEDSDQNLWVSVQEQGVVKYSLRTKQATIYKPVADGGQLAGKAIRHISEDKNGNIWLASFEEGITIYNPREDRFTYLNTANSPLTTNSIVRTQSIDNGFMLISTLDEGLFSFDTEKKKLHNLAKNTTSFALEYLTNKTLLVGTEGQGLFFADKADRALVRHSAVSLQSKNIVNSKIHALLEDCSGNIWVGMYNEGIAFIKREPSGFTRYKRRNDSHGSLSYGQVTGMTTDKLNNVWFATDGGGLNYYDRKLNTYTYYMHRSGDEQSIADNAVVSVYCDNHGTVSAGTYTGGLCRFNAATGTFTSFQHAANQNSLPGNYVKSIVEDKAGNLWLGTDGSGFSYFDKANGTFLNFSVKDHKELGMDYITCLYLQDNKTLWIGTHAGVSKMDVGTKKITSCGNHEFATYTIVADNDNNIWIGTALGLYKYNENDNTFTKPNLSVQFANIVVNGIVPYNDFLWLSTSLGIICYHPDTEEIRYYVNNNDLDNTNFIRSSYYISPDNEIFFGGGDGSYSFFPDSLNLQSNFTKVFLSELEIFNAPILPGKPYKDNIILDKSLLYTDKITLNHSENTLTFRFASPAVSTPASLLYMCFMDGVDKQWTPYSYAQQSVTYANLSPGKYTFNIYATNVLSLNAEPENITMLHVIIHPPVWLTWWMKLLYIVGVLGFIGIVLGFVYQRMKDKNELNLEKIRSKELEELDKSKMQFFTNISHEFRTPLTLIISPLEELRKAIKNSAHVHTIDIMLRNANRLMILINQILDLRKADNNKLKIKVQPINLNLFVKDIADLFWDGAHKKNIEISVKVETENMEVWYDPDLLGKSLFNIFSNALKYTPENGRIDLKINHIFDNFIAIEIRDTGTGIEVSELPHLFERFHQSPSSEKSGMGTGIGLHLVKTITELHHGRVEVESQPGKGTCFTIYVRTGKEYFTENECDNTPWSPLIKEIDKPDINQSVNAFTQIDTHADIPILPNSAKSSILLVEDELDMRSYIRSHLVHNYNVEEAANGAVALTLMKTLRPDLIITDVMMPEMDGIEFTRILKDNVDTCDIPIILLTANSEIEQKLHGLETGADSYIVKPFSMEYLLARVRKLLDTRRKIRDKYQLMLSLEPQEVSMDNPDEVLLQNSIAYIRDNITEPELSVEEMAKFLNMSRTSLHRKIKTLTGNSPVELIKVIRMKQAAYLLDQGTLTVSEVAYEVGYNSLSYFSSSFSKYWGVSPAAYLRNKVDSKD